MIIKYLIVIVFIAILLSLGSGLYFMLKDKGKSKRMVNSLTVRISLFSFYYLYCYLWPGILG